MFSVEKMRIELFMATEWQSSGEDLNLAVLLHSVGNSCDPYLGTKGHKAGEPPEKLQRIYSILFIYLFYFF